MASAYVFFETAVKRPTISTSKIIAMVAMTILQISPNPKRAPASPAVAIVPASRNPPVAVTIPSVMENHFLLMLIFIGLQLSGIPRLLDSALRPGYANRRSSANRGCLLLAWLYGRV